MGTKSVAEMTVAEMRDYCKKHKVKLPDAGEGSGASGGLVRADYVSAIKAHDDKVGGKKQDGFAARPMGRLADAPVLPKDKPSGLEYAVWRTEVDDWVVNAQDNMHKPSDMYMALMKNMGKALKEEFIGTHRTAAERTLSSLLGFYALKFEPLELQASEDKAKFESFRRGNMRLKDVREEWQAPQGRSRGVAGISSARPGGR